MLPVTGWQPKPRFKNLCWNDVGLRDFCHHHSCCCSLWGTKWKQILQIEWERFMGPRRNIKWLYPRTLPCVAPHWICCTWWLTASETRSSWSMKAWTPFGHEEKFCWSILLNGTEQLPQGLKSLPKASLDIAGGFYLWISLRLGDHKAAWHLAVKTWRNELEKKAFYSVSFLSLSEELSINLIPESLH